MALDDLYDPHIAYNPDTEQLVTGAVFQVFAPDDASFTTPLTLTDPASGTGIATLRSSNIGVLPAFRVAGDLPQVVLKSGAFTTLLSSRFGALIEAGFDPEAIAAAVDAAPAAEAARDEAIEAKEAAEAVGTTNDAIMTAVGADPTSAFANFLYGTFPTPSNVGAFVAGNAPEIIDAAAATAATTEGLVRRVTPSVSTPQRPPMVVVDGTFLRFDPLTGDLDADAAKDAFRQITTPPFAPTPGAVGTSYRNRLSAIQLKSLKYLLGTYIPAQYGSLTGDPIIFPTAAQANMHAPGLCAFSIAYALYSGSYSEAVTGVPAATAKAAAIRLLTSVARAHTANNNAPRWGGNFLTGLWAFMSGMAARMLWDDLSEPERVSVSNMVIGEANLSVTNKPALFWTSRLGVEQYPGDTKAEELAWDVLPLALAYTMNPKHANAEAWLTKLVAQSVATTSRPEDNGSVTVVNGIAVDDLVDGWNFRSDGMVVNHNRLAPDYSISVIQTQATAAAIFHFAGLRAPRAVFHNAQLIVRNLYDDPWATPTYRAPGGVVFKRDGRVYFPEFDDSGAIFPVSNQAVQAATAAIIEAAGLNALASVQPTAIGEANLTIWEGMQARFTTGQTYDTGETDNSTAEPSAAYWASLALFASHITRRPSSNLPVRAYLTLNGGL